MMVGDETKTSLIMTSPWCSHCQVKKVHWWWVTSGFCVILV